jgi:hypothetical protein
MYTSSSLRGGVLYELRLSLQCFLIPIMTIALAVALTSQAEVEQQPEAVQQVVKQAKRNRGKLRVGADVGGGHDRVGHTRREQARSPLCLESGWGYL